MLRCNLHRVLRRDIPGKGVTRSGGRMGIMCDSAGLGGMGLVARTGTKRYEAHLPVNLHVLSARWISFKLGVESQQSEWPYGTPDALCLCLLVLYPLHNFKFTSSHTTPYAKSSPTRRDPNVPPHLSSSLDSQISSTNLLHPSRAVTYPQISHQIYFFRLHLGNVLPPFHNQHLLLRLRLPSSILLSPCRK